MLLALAVCVGRSSSLLTTRPYSNLARGTSKSGAIVFETAVLANSGGCANALKLVDVYASGRRAFAVEGTGSFGAGLTRFLTGQGERVLEVGRLRRERRSGGKTDALDAIRAARSVLEQPRPATPRAGGERPALQALVAAHRTPPHSSSSPGHTAAGSDRKRRSRGSPAQPRYPPPPARQSAIASTEAVTASSTVRCT
jgi:hypothetical protein